MLTEIAPAVGPNNIIVSVAAGVTIDSIQKVQNLTSLFLQLNRIQQGCLTVSNKLVFYNLTVSNKVV